MGELDQAVRSGRISGLSDFMIMIREKTGLELRPYPLPNDLRHLKGIREKIRYRRLIAFTALRTGFGFGAKRLEQFLNAMDRNQIDFGKGRLKITVDKDGMMKYERR